MTANPLLTSQNKFSLHGANKIALLSQTDVTNTLTLGAFNILSHPLTVQTHDRVYVMGNYAGATAPAQPTASWSSGDAATLSYWQASDGWWECVVDTPMSATGVFTLTVNGQTTPPITVNQGDFDLPPGLYITPTAVYGYNNPAFDGQGAIRMGLYTVRGLVGNPTYTITDTVPGSGDAAHFGVDTIRTALVNNVWQSLATEWRITLNVTDGIFTFSQDIVVYNPSATEMSFFTGNMIAYTSDAVLGGGFDPPVIQFGSQGFWPEMITVVGGTITVQDPANAIQWIAGNRVFAIDQATAIANPGAYPVTITMTDANNNTQSWENVTFYVVNRQPPALSWRPGLKIYDYMPALTKVGTLSYHVDDQLWTIHNAPLVDVQCPPAYIGVYGDLYIANKPEIGVVELTFGVSDRLNTTEVRILLPIEHGTVLPSSNITFTPLPSPLDNSMARPSIPSGLGWSVAQALLLTTLSVSGFTKPPTWSINVRTSEDLPDNCQIAYYAGPIDNTINCPPRYSFNGPAYTQSGIGPVAPQLTITGTEGITLYASNLSAQTDHVYLTADDGEGTCCTLLLPVTVAEKIGPNIDCGPGLPYVKGVSYPTVNQLMGEWYNDPPSYDGAVVTLHPGIDPTHDLNYTAHSTASGFLNGWWPGPVTLKSPEGTVRTVLDYNGGNNGSQPEAGIVCNNYDMTLINLEVCNCTAVGEQGGPNAGGIYMNGNCPGNLTIKGCYIHNCDNGIMNGDWTGRHVVVEDTILQRCGADDGSGRTHNIYVSTISSFTMRNCQSDATEDDHLVKSRAMVTRVENCKLRQGAQAVFGGVPVDCPQGGLIFVTDCIIIPSSNPGNNGQFAEFGEENGTTFPVWPEQSVTVSGNTWYNIAAPQAVNNGNTPATGLNLHTGRSIVNGTPAFMVWSNNKFYNLEQSQWVGPGLYGNFSVYYVATAANVIDGGGNVAITDYTPQVVIDPLTGERPINPPPYYLGHVNTSIFNRNALITKDAFQLDFCVPTAPSVGALVATFVANYAAVDLTTPTFTINTIFQANGTRLPISLPTTTFAIDSPGGNLTVNVADLADGLYYLNMSGQGMDVNNNPQQITQWVPVVIGTGHVPAS